MGQDEWVACGGETPIGGLGLLWGGGGIEEEWMQQKKQNRDPPREVALLPPNGDAIGPWERRKRSEKKKGVAKPLRSVFYFVGL